MRIAADLEVAVADRLHAIAALAPELRARLDEGAHDPARALLARIADSAREALADVRRVLGHPAPRRRRAEPRAARGRRRPRAAARGGARARGAAGARRRRPAARPRPLDRILVLVLLAVAQVEFLLRASAPRTT